MNMRLTSKRPHSISSASDAEELTRDFYETQAKAYFWSTVGLGATELTNMLTKRLEEDDLLLDLGCGSGRDSRFFAEYGLNVVAVDLSLSLLKLSSAYSCLPHILANIRQLPFKRGVFDAVWAMASLLHIPKHQIRQTLLGILQVLRPDGFLFTSVKGGVGEEIDASGRFFAYYEPEEWKALLAENGFRLLEIQETFEHRRSTSGQEQIIKWIACVSVVDYTLFENISKHSCVRKSIHLAIY